MSDRHCGNEAGQRCPETDNERPNANAAIERRLRKRLEEKKLESNVDDILYGGHVARVFDRSECCTWRYSRPYTGGAFFLNPPQLKSIDGHAGV